MKKPIMIDLATLGGRSYLGQDRGKEARSIFKLDDLDSNDGVIIVHFPEGSIALASSFFQGLFAPSVQTAGSKDAFLEKYNFLAMPRHIERSVMQGIDRALIASVIHV
jgi:hypothetical protein